jgi:hypothetical protein
VLHQFLSAEMVQVSEESVFLNLLGVLFLGHFRTVIESQSHVKSANSIIQMASNPNYVKKQLTIDTVSWTAIVAPIDCMGVAIKNPALVDLRIRTDSADATTQDTISAGSVETISVPRHASGVQDGGSGVRFYAGDTIAYLQAVSGTGPAQLTFVR